MAEAFVKKELLGSVADIDDADVDDLFLQLYLAEGREDDFGTILFYYGMVLQDWNLTENIMRGL